MIRRPPRSTQSRSSAASDVYKRQVLSGAKDEEDDLASGIVDGPDQGCLRPPTLQPVEGAAVYLQQHPFRGAAFSPPPMHRGGCPGSLAKPRLLEQAVEGGAADGNLLPRLA